MWELWPILLLVAGTFLLICGLIGLNIGDENGGLLGALLTFLGVTTTSMGALGCIVWFFSSLLTTVPDMEKTYSEYYSLFLQQCKNDSVTVLPATVTRVIRYNQNLAWYRERQDHWFYAPFLYSVPSDLKPIPLHDPNEKRSGL